MYVQKAGDLRQSMLAVSTRRTASRLNCSLKDRLSSHQNSLAGLRRCYVCVPTRDNLRLRSALKRSTASSLG